MTPAQRAAADGKWLRDRITAHIRAAEDIAHDRALEEAAASFETIDLGLPIMTSGATIASALRAMKRNGRETDAERMNRLAEDVGYDAC